MDGAANAPRPGSANFELSRKSATNGPVKGLHYWVSRTVFNELLASMKARRRFITISSSAAESADIRARRTFPLISAGCGANEKICGHVKKARWQVTLSGLASSTNSRERGMSALPWASRMPRNHAVRPPFLGNHNVASRGLKLFQAIKTIAAPGSDHRMQLRGYFGPHQLNNASAGG